MHTQTRSVLAATMLVAVVMLFGIGTVAAKSPASDKAKADPITNFRDAAIRELQKMVKHEGITIEAEHTAVLAREDIVLVAAPLTGIATIPVSQFFDGQWTDLAVAYMSAPGDGSGSNGAMAADLYVLSARATASPDPTGELPELELLWTGRGGQQYVWPGVLVWSDDSGAAPDPAGTRIDLAVSEQDTDAKPLSREIVIQIWIEIKSWRECWRWVIKVPDFK